MKVKVFLVLLLVSRFLIPDSSMLVQSSKGQLIQLMRGYVGMVQYDGETFFIDGIKNNGGSTISLKSHEEFASPKQLFLDLAKIKTSTLSIKRRVNSETGEFERYEVRFQGLGTIYQHVPGREPLKYTNINICLAGKELYDATTDERNMADSMLVLIKEASANARAMVKTSAVKTYKIPTANSLMVDLLNAKEVDFLANNRSGQYLTIQGGMKEFFGTVNTVCIDYATGTPLSEIQPEVSLPVTYILVRNYEGKRETVAEIPDTFPNQSGTNICCRNCLEYPDRETFPSGAYEVFIYLGDQQTRKLGNFMFAVR